MARGKRLLKEELWGCRVRFEYPVCKLSELADY
jgi:hypothetical protein